MKFYYNITSQPSRTIKFILDKTGVQYDSESIEFITGTRSEQFKKNVNKRGKVPVLEVDGEMMVESGAISRYLLDSLEADETLLSRSDLKKRSQVESWLDINGSIYRPDFTDAYQKIKLSSIMMGTPKPSEEECKKLMSKVDASLKDLDGNLDGKSFLTGDDMTIADIQIYFEIVNVSTILQLGLNEYPNILTWRAKIAEDPTVSKLDAEFFEEISKMKEKFEAKAEEDAKKA